MTNIVRIWILLSTLLVSAGWILSAFHQLNGVGYGAFFIVAILGFIFLRSKRGTQPGKSAAQFFQKFRARFKRPAPLLFLAMAALSLLGGLLYAPSNGSSASYRIPRVMEWLAAGQWHWIRTLDVRMNIAGSGMEWFFAPLILLTRSDRLLFLPNWISFLLLPGLIFSVFTRLRISSRAAWWWMWLLPSGWCFIMQAGSTINDSFAAVYALAAVDFALHARDSRRTSDVYFSLLSAALATGVKQSDILLAIPGLIALWPRKGLLLKRPLVSAAVGMLCLLISAVPTIFFNLKETRNWAGVSVDASVTWGNTELSSPVWGVIGNAFALTAQNLKPPVFPFVRSWNAAMKHFLHTPFGAHFKEFEDFGRLSFGTGESAAALGAGIVLLALLSFFAARHYGRKMKPATTEKRLEFSARLVIWVPWILLLAFMAKIGTFENGRQFASYYILLFPSILIIPGHSILIRQRWWKSLSVLVMVVAAGLLVISRDRPLFPAQTIIGRIEARYPNSKFVANVSRTYAETPAFRQQQMHLRNTLPSGESVIGYAAWVDGQAGSSLWLPFGQRRIQYVLPADTGKQLRSEGINYVVVAGDFLDQTHDTVQQWNTRNGGVLATQWECLINPYEPPQRFYLVHLQDSTD